MRIPNIVIKNIRKRDDSDVVGLKGLLGKVWFSLGHQPWKYLEFG